MEILTNYSILSLCGLSVPLVSCSSVYSYILSVLDPTKNYGAEKYGPNSVCLIQKSAFVMEQCRRKLSYPDWGSGCYQVSMCRGFVLFFLKISLKGKVSHKV